MKKQFFAIFVCLVAFNSAYGLKGGRYDPQILTATSRILQGNSNYKNVYADVDDGIVTLTGTVKLESLRAGLEYKIHRLPNVAGVRNQVLLDPPPIDDKVLLSRLSNNLREAGFDTVRVKAHNGAVTLIGTVRTQRERNRVTQTAWSTDGVKEVYSQLSVAY